MSLGSKIRDLRIQKGLTQSDLGSGLVTPSMISQIESDKANPSYKVLEAIAEKLETPLEHFLADIQTQMEQTTAHKVAKALISSGSHEKAADLLCSLLDTPAPNLNLMECQYDLAVCCFHLELLDETLFLLTTVREMAQEKGSPSIMIQALNLQGLTEQKRYKYHRAIYCWRRACDYFVQLAVPEPFVQSEVLKNLGDAHQWLGEYQDALDCYNESALLLINSSYVEQTGKVYMSLGISYQKVRDYEKATEYAQFAQAIYESVKHVKFSIDVKRLQGILKVEAGQYGKAIETLSECQKAYGEHGYIIESLAVYGDLAALHFHAGCHAECMENCQKAIDALGWDALETAPIWKTLGIALDQVGKIEDSIQAFERAESLFSACNRLKDLADVYSKLGCLYEKQGKVEKANESLHKMKGALEEGIRLRGIEFG